MEKFTIKVAAATSPEAKHNTLCGIVSSGNLEVLIEKNDDPASCSIEVSTSAIGFKEIWEAVLTDFAKRYPVGGLRIAINDAGATPAVVTLRLSQAVENSRSDKS